MLVFAENPCDRPRWISLPANTLNWTHRGWEARGRLRVLRSPLTWEEPLRHTTLGHNGLLVLRSTPFTSDRSGTADAQLCSKPSVCFVCCSTLCPVTREPKRALQLAAKEEKFIFSATEALSFFQIFSTVPVHLKCQREKRSPLSTQQREDGHGWITEHSKEFVWIFFIQPVQVDPESSDRLVNKTCCQGDAAQYISAAFWKSQLLRQHSGGSGSQEDWKHPPRGSPSKVPHLRSYKKNATVHPESALGAFFLVFSSAQMSEWVGLPTFTYHLWRSRTQLLLSVLSDVHAQPRQQSKHIQAHAACVSLEACTKRVFFHGLQPDEQKEEIIDEVKDKSWKLSRGHWRG